MSVAQTHDPSDSGLIVAVTPQGHLILQSGPAESSLDAQVAQRSSSAFAVGPGHFLLHLGTTELFADLPPDFAFFRELARRFLLALCAIPDLEEQRDRIAVTPPADLAKLADSVPPMLGAEYVNAESLTALWTTLEAAVRDDLEKFSGSVQEYLTGKNPLWNLLGRVHFHLVENKRQPEQPFAFLATYTNRISSQTRLQHLPLGKALAEYSEAANKDALLALLTPVQKAASKSPFLKGLVDSGEIFHPLSFTPAEAYQFLKDLPAFEASGVVVRVPDFWRNRQPPRPQVSVTVGKNSPVTLGISALLDFSVGITLDGEVVSEQEWQEILRSSDGLALIKGRWVEVDRAKLSQALTHWKAVQKAAAQGELSFVQAMRLVAGAAVTERDEEVLNPATADWSQVMAGDFLAELLNTLRHPEELASADPGPELLATLRPYQQVGIGWLQRLDQLGLSACLADDMGLGKTIQVLALLLLKRKRRLMSNRKASAPSLLVVPASLIANWQAELCRFAPSLRALVAHPSVLSGSALSELVPASVAEVELCITSYGTVHRLPFSPRQRGT